MPRVSVEAYCARACSSVSRLAVSQQARLRGVAFIALGGVIGLDLWTKSIAQQRWSTPVDLFWKLRFVYTVNHGAAFSTFQGAARWLLLAAAVIVAVLLIVLWRTRKYSVALPLALLTGGAFGNALGRALRPDHGVVDFIDPQIWPVFNVADAAITVGCVWLGLNLVLRPRGDHGD